MWACVSDLDSPGEALEEVSGEVTIGVTCKEGS